MVFMKMNKTCTLITTISLLIAPIHVSASSVQADERMAQEKQECSEDNTLTWDSRLNRCVRSETSQKELDEYKECAELTDDKEKLACHEKIAKDRSGKRSKDEGTDGEFINVIFGSAALLNVIALNGTDSACTGGYVAAATGILGVFAQKAFVKKAKKKLTSLQDEYKENSEVEDPYQSQIKAFQYLKDEQDAISSLAKKRQQTYYALTAGYGYAAYTTMASDWIKAGCGKDDASEKSNDAAKENPKKDVAEVKKEAPPKKEGAGGDKASGTGKGDAIATAAGFMPVFANPTTLIAASILGTVWNLKLAMAAGKQAKEAKENADRIGQVIADFKTNVAGLCPEGREDMENARCFCYQGDGEKNPNRTNSGICQKLWAQDDRNLHVDPNDLMAGVNNNPVGCMDINGNFDSNCKCKKFKTNNGQNACMKVGTPTNVNMGGANQFTAPQLLGNANNMINGNQDLGVFKGFDAEGQAAIAKRFVEQAAKKLNLNAKKNGQPPIKVTGRYADKIAKRISKSKLANKATGGAKFNSIAAGRPTKGAIGQALKKAQKTAGINKVSFSNNRTSLGSSGNKKKKRYDFSFDEGSSGGKIQNFAGSNKKYNYKENDIVTRDDVSIWKVISRRYNVSGLKRLFPDE